VATHSATPDLAALRDLLKYLSGKNERRKDGLTEMERRKGNTD